MTELHSTIYNNITWRVIPLSAPGVVHIMPGQQFCLFNHIKGTYSLHLKSIVRVVLSEWSCQSVLVRVVLSEWSCQSVLVRVVLSEWSCQSVLVRVVLSEWSEPTVAKTSMYQNTFCDVFLQTEKKMSKLINLTKPVFDNASSIITDTVSFLLFPNQRHKLTNVRKTTCCPPKHCT